jgi:hypothetical protein
MSDYNLSGLSTRSFEKLIQSIAGKVIGLGTVTFGDGPDGGREATFEGRMDYPSTADPWEGYCVIQAKFLQRPRDPGSDGRWALEQLEGELKTFADPKKRRRRPDYYIFATNVVLTPVQDRGGKDRAATLFKKYQKKVPLRGWAMWDFDEIGKFLDNYNR